jgi:hypothetical protein
MGNKVGRPSEYKPEFTDTIIARGREGCSVIERSCGIGIHSSTYYEWINPESDVYHPDFHEAHLIAEEACQMWWEQHGRTYLVVNGKDSPRLDAQVYRLNMMNRFGWGENNRNHNTNDTTIDVTISKPQAPKE